MGTIMLVASFRFSMQKALFDEMSFGIINMKNILYAVKRMSVLCQR